MSSTEVAGERAMAEARSAGYVRSFRAVPEHGFTPMRVEGKLPRALDGTMYRNGPGLFAHGEHRYRHWFDGDGLVAAVRFADGRAEGASKLLETPGLLEERAKGRAVHAAYGTKAPGGFSLLRMLRFLRQGGKNPANTSVLAWRDRVFALCEAGVPNEIDPDTLASLGEVDLGGAVTRAFSAHPHRIASNGTIYNVGAVFGRRNGLEVTVLRPDGTAGRLGLIPLAYPTMVHDFALTERHLVIFVAPLEIALFRVLFGRESFAEAHRWDEARGTEVIVVPLDAPDSVTRFSTGAFWAWHTANAFERGRELVVDLVRYADYPSTARWLAGVPEGRPGGDPDGRLHRLVIDPRRRTLRSERLRARTGEFPRVAPSVDAASYRTAYLLEHSTPAAARVGPPDTVVRVDVETGESDEHCFGPAEWPSEAVFVPRPGRSGETDGWLVSLVYDAQKDQSAWVVLDAAHVNDGPIARVWLGHHVPLGFHGAWRPRP